MPPGATYLGSHQTSPAASSSPMLVGHHNHHLLYHHSQHPNDWYPSTAPPSAGDAMNHLNHFSHHHHHLAVHHGAATAYWAEADLDNYNKFNYSYSYNWLTHHSHHSDIHSSRCRHSPQSTSTLCSLSRINN